MPTAFLPLAAAALLALTGVTPGPGARALDDAQIAHIAVTANQLDVAAAQQALEKSTDPVVRAFAETMIRDHQGVIQKATALATELHVTPMDNETSRALTSSAEATRARLAGLDGAAFDRAYMDNEVTYHQAVIQAVEETLVPNTRNAELRQLLQAVLPALKAHLAQAQHLAAALSG